MAKSDKLNISIITLAGAIILGQVQTDKDNTVIKNSLSLGQVPDVTKKHLADYIKADNLGTLSKDITVAGPAMFTTRELSDELQLELQILQLKFEQAVKSAPAKAINAEFTSLIGG